MVYPDLSRKFMHRFVSNTWPKNSKLLHWFKIRQVSPSINLKWKFQKVKFLYDSWRHCDVTNFITSYAFIITVFDWLMFHSRITFLSDLRKVTFCLMNHLQWVIYICHRFSIATTITMAIESVNHVKLFTHLYIDEATRQKRPKSSSFHCEGNLGK